ncbi:MAG: hypothetical protein EBR82_48255 [Caulobacteraceae bacterium]|nr:hypothetical protein [Caulobacteraceae bacterium]
MPDAPDRPLTPGKVKRLLDAALASAPAGAVVVIEAGGVRLQGVGTGPCAKDIQRRATNELKARMRARVRAHLKGSGKTPDWPTWLGYSVDDLRAHLEARFTEGMTWQNIGRWHIDHIRPLASFTITGPDCPEFRAAWALENLQPLWAKDNLSKGARWKP